MDVFYSFTHNCQNLEAIKLSFNGWMNKQAVVHSANKVLFRALKKKEYQPTKRHGGIFNPYYYVKEANVQKATYYMIPTTQHSGKKLWRPKKFVI